MIAAGKAFLETGVTSVVEALVRRPEELRAYQRLRKEGLKRMFLHARSLAFAHPLTGEALRLESPLPADLEAFRARHLAA